ncbi:MAG: hypothetical protein ACR2KJ_13580 [Jatrophihabitans sp.]
MRDPQARAADALRAAIVAVRAIEKRMLAPLTAPAQQRLLADLAACANALSGDRHA